MSVSEEWAGTAMCPGCFTADAEIRDLNDALTAALQRDIGDETLMAVMQRRYGREARQWKANHDERKRERDLLQSQLDVVRAMPFVPRRDYDIAVQTKDEALRTIDALAAKVQRMEDRTSEVRAQRCLQILRDVMATMSRETGDPGQEQVRNGARSFLAELGVVSPEHEAHRQAYERWEEGKR